MIGLELQGRGGMKSPVELLAWFRSIIASQSICIALLSQALVRRADGVMLLNEFGQLTFFNDIARRVLSQNDGLRLSGNTVVADRPPEHRTLAKLIRDTSLHAQEGSRKTNAWLLVTRPSGSRPYVLRLIAAPETWPWSAPACIVLVHVLAEQTVPSKDALQEAFGLTLREADLVVELVRRPQLAAASAASRMAVNTARNHLRSIFAKTGTASQAEAVQLLSRLPPD